MAEEETEQVFEYDNPMRKPRIQKVVVNIGVGEGGDALITAETVIEMVTGREPVRTEAKVTNPEFGIREGMPIGCKVTLRDEEDWRGLLEDMLWVRNDELMASNIDDQGNVSFGIPDYTDLPDHKYDPDIGVVGMNVNVTIERPGGRVKRRKRRPRKIPDEHRVSKEETIQFLEDEFGVEVI